MMLSPRERDHAYYQASMEYAQTAIEIAESTHTVIKMAELHPGVLKTLSKDFKIDIITTDGAPTYMLTRKPAVAKKRKCAIM